MGNRDDHLRNHGFILGEGGWRLSPAFDVNPDPDKETHVLAIDETDTRPDIATVRFTAPYYRLRSDAAETIVADVLTSVRTWRDTARRLGLSREEILQTAPAFEQT